MMDDRKNLPNGIESMRSMNSRRSLGLDGQDSFSKEMVARIYREELSKLASAAQKSGNMAEHSMYRQELTRMSVTLKEDGEKKRVHQNDHRSGTPVKKIKTEPGEDTSNDTESPSPYAKAMSERDSETPGSRRPESNGSITPKGSAPSPDEIRHNGSAFFLVKPRPAFDSPSIAAAIDWESKVASLGYPPNMLVNTSTANESSVSPLQRMQSIANSLMSGNGSSKPGAALGFNGQNSGKPLRAVLPPISQEQFDNHANINTDDLVHRVKETLSQYSISQRLFGEHILGLSQGSVSDLLARPKPWHMLTQKGREPFIRMKIFMDDQAAVLSLVSNQYHIEPDKLLRTNIGRNNNNIKTPSGKLKLSL